MTESLQPGAQPRVDKDSCNTAHLFKEVQDFLLRQSNREFKRFCKEWFQINFQSREVCPGVRVRPAPASQVTSKSKSKPRRCNFPCPSVSLIAALSAQIVPEPLDRLEAICAIRELAYFAFLDRFGGRPVSRSPASYEKLLKERFQK